MLLGLTNLLGLGASSRRLVNVALTHPLKLVGSVALELCYSYLVAAVLGLSPPQAA